MELSSFTLNDAMLLGRNQIPEWEEYFSRHSGFFHHTSAHLEDYKAASSEWHVISKTSVQTEWNLKG